MHTAFDKRTNQSIYPTQSGFIAECKCCYKQVKAFVGPTLSPHWKHVNANEDCQASTKYNGGAEGKWHQTSKSIFTNNLDEMEVRVEKNGIVKIADVMLPNGLVIECQHSSIDGNEIKDREEFYQDMIWYFDASGPVEKGTLKYTGKNYEWVSPRLSLIHCTKPVLLDLGYQNIVYLQSFSRDSTTRLIGSESNYEEKTVSRFNFGAYTYNPTEVYGLVNSFDSVEKINIVEDVFNKDIRHKAEIENKLKFAQSSRYYCQSISERDLMDDYIIMIKEENKNYPTEIKYLLKKINQRVIREYESNSRPELGMLYNYLLWESNS